MKLTKTADSDTKNVPRRLPRWANAYIDIMDGGPGTGWSESLYLRCSEETGIVCWQQEGFEQDPDTLTVAEEMTVTARGRFHVSKGIMGLARSLAIRGNKYDYNGPGFSSPSLEMWQLHLLRECLCFDEYRGASHPLLISLTAAEVKRLAEASDGFREPWVRAAATAMLGDLIDDEGPDDPLEFRRQLWKRFGSRYPGPEAWKEIGEGKLVQQESLRQYHEFKFAEAAAARERGPRKGPIPAADLRESSFRSVVDHLNHPQDVECRAKVFHFIKDRKLFGEGAPMAMSSLLWWLLKPVGEYENIQDQSVAQVQELVVFDPQAGQIVERFRDLVREGIDNHDPNPPVHSMGCAIGRNMKNAAIRTCVRLQEILEDERCGLPARNTA